MKQQQNSNLGFLPPASQACLIEGCDPDFFLMSSVVVPGATALSGNLPTAYANLTAAFPGGLGSNGSGLWFFQNGLSELHQSRKEYLQGGVLTSASSAVAGQIALESMQVSMVGLQIASAYGNTPVLPKDVKVIADSGLFEMWLDGGTNADRPDFSLYSDISVPVVTMPSHIGVYGTSTTESSAGFASLGVPGLMFAAELKEKPILQKGQLIGARLSFPAQSVPNGLTTAPVDATPPSLTTVGGVLVRLFLFGKAKYKNRS